NTLSVSGSYTTYQWYLNGQIITNANGATYNVTGNGNYTVMVTGSTGCSETSAIKTITGMGVANVTNSNEVSIYPNPAVSNVFIDAPVSVNVSISDMD